MSDKKQPKFEAGERVLVEAEYQDCYGESTWVGSLYVDAIPYEGTSMNVARSHIHPYPREGEHRLTVEELFDLVTSFLKWVDENRDGDYRWVRLGEIDAVIKQWLANRKEAGND